MTGQVLCRVCNMKDISTKVFKLLRQQKYTIPELQEVTKVPGDDLRQVIDGLAKKGVDIQEDDHGYSVKDRHFISDTHIISQASPEPKTTRYIATSDWHVGSIQHDARGLESCMGKAIDQGAQFILHSGDICDGYGVYPGQLNNLAVWKVEDQANLVAKFIETLPIRMYAIDGNHDHSYTMASGIRPVKLISQMTTNLTDLGDFQADVVLDGIEIRLLHGAGGNAYAQSYPAQKYLRNLAEGTPEQVPEILELGHYHTNPTFEIYGCFVIHPSNFQLPNDFMIRRGLRGVRGLYLVELTTQYGELINYTAKFIKAP